MKINRFFGIVFFMFISFAFLFSAQDANYHKRIYNQARNLVEKKEKMKAIYEVADDTYKTLVIDILDEQLNYGKERNKGLVKDYEEWIYYSSMTAGKLKISEAAPKMKVLFTYLQNSIIRGTVVYSIGLTKNKDMLPWINLLLTDLNDLHRVGKIRGNEEMVIGTIKALAEFKDFSSFRPLFYAAMPNYPDNIRKQALDLFLSLTDDPAKYIGTVINFENDYNMIFQAQDFVYKSKSTNEEKVNTCLMTIERVLSTVGLKNQTNIQLLQQILDTSVLYIGELKSQDPNAVIAIQKKWDNDVNLKNKVYENMHSILKNIEALEKMASVEANKALTDRLKYFNDKTSEGSNTGYGEKDGGTILFAIIDALGRIGSNDADTFFELKRITLSTDYGDPHKRRAEEAIVKLKK
ncbi:MAG: hypothetical protein A2015_16530 [Spirochaetes bacterium GWF1_31_7]|nr:MAG: hypothetical protein A2Y30_13895 [Spirochaetes bacterium GWE1_32_154]OHD50051.1 MAG: hypothetical protein A2Y29_11940 [Spirochaetes bacterium GWE2_31_10]OHD52365.1 MAG: hypothetical protein A2015_16530 [Spirochaetes bacterium GWF1_31_7]OHD81681.1 MAG: hypothetical protein A2355_07380 [Spirochaetes bacterium RIFOXYB1_FULL_32_8]HBD96005.1 hypothetical protein [Spirochaetia bacterium]